MALSAPSTGYATRHKGKCLGTACRALQARLFQIADHTSLLKPTNQGVAGCVRTLNLTPEVDNWVICWIKKCVVPVGSKVDNAQGCISYPPGIILCFHGTFGRDPAWSLSFFCLKRGNANFSTRPAWRR